MDENLIAEGKLWLARGGICVARVLIGKNQPRRIQSSSTLFSPWACLCGESEPRGELATALHKEILEDGAGGIRPAADHERGAGIGRLAMGRNVPGRVLLPPAAEAQAVAGCGVAGQQCRPAGREIGVGGIGQPGLLRRTVAHCGWLRFYHQQVQQRRQGQGQQQAQQQQTPPAPAAAAGAGAAAAAVTGHERRQNAAMFKFRNSEVGMGSRATMPAPRRKDFDWWLCKRACTQRIRFFDSIILIGFILGKTLSCEPPRLILCHLQSKQKREHVGCMGRGWTSIAA